MKHGLPRSQWINEQNFHFCKIFTVGVGDLIVGTVGTAGLAWARGWGGGFLLLCELITAALPTWMDTEGLQHGAINILFINVEWVLQANYALFHGQKESKEV